MTSRASIFTFWAARIASSCWRASRSACIAVVYLGHVDASIPCAPARLGRFLIVPENDSLYNSRLHVLVLDEDGAKVRPVQDLDVSGWTWQTPASAGPIVWGLGDKGGYEAFSVGDYASKTPFRSLARLTADARRRGRHSRWRGRIASSGWLRGTPDDSTSTSSGDRSSPRSPIVQPGSGAGTDPEGGKCSCHDLPGPDEPAASALWGVDPETERRRLEDGRRRAVASPPRRPAGGQTL